MNDRISMIAWSFVCRSTAPETRALTAAPGHWTEPGAAVPLGATLRTTFYAFANLDSWSTLVGFSCGHLVTVPALRETAALIAKAAVREVLLSKKLAKRLSAASGSFSKCVGAPLIINQKPEITH